MSEIQAILLTAYAILTGLSLALGLWWEEGDKVYYLGVFALSHSVCWLIMSLALLCIKVFNSMTR